MQPAPPPREPAPAPSRGLPITGKIVSIDPALARGSTGAALAATVLARAGGVTTLATTEGEIALRLATLLRAGQPVRLELPPNPRPPLTALVTPEPSGRPPEPAATGPREAIPPTNQPPQPPPQRTAHSPSDAPPRPAAAGPSHPRVIGIATPELSTPPQQVRPSAVPARHSAERPDQANPPPPPRPTPELPQPKTLNARAAAAYAAIDRFAGVTSEPSPAPDGHAPPPTSRGTAPPPPSGAPGQSAPESPRPSRLPPTNAPQPQPTDVTRSAPRAQPTGPDVAAKPQTPSAGLPGTPQTPQKTEALPARPTVAETRPAPLVRSDLTARPAPAATAQPTPRAGDAGSSALPRPSHTPPAAANADGPRPETPVSPGSAPRPTQTAPQTPGLDPLRPILPDPTATVAAARNGAVASLPMPEGAARPGTPSAAPPPTPTPIPTPSVDDAAPRSIDTPAGGRATPVVAQPTAPATPALAEQLAAAQRALTQPPASIEAADAQRGPAPDAPEARTGDRADPQAPIARADLSAPLADLFDRVYDEPPPSHVATAADDALIAEATLSQIGLFRIETRETASGFALVVRHAELLSEAAAGAVADSVRAEAERLGATVRVRAVYDPALRPTS